MEQSFMQMMLPHLLNGSLLQKNHIITITSDNTMVRPPCCDKANVKRGPWTAEEDAKILAYVASHGIGNWTLVPQKAGLNRCGKSCRLRWTNYLRPDLKHDNFTPEEEECILELHKTIGSRWSLIAKRLPGRTDNDVKNYWNTKLKKKLIKMGIDPVTHKPFSQLFSEYGKISGYPNTNPNYFIQSPTNNAQKIEHPLIFYDQELVQSQHFSEPSSSDTFSAPSYGVTSFACSSSRSCEPEQAQMAPFSACDEYITDQVGECEYEGSVTEVVSGEKCVDCMDEDGKDGNGKERFTDLNGGDSFVEDILAHDVEMRLQFPDIFDENYEF